MEDKQKNELRRRLDAYTANLGPPKRLGNWQVYAAVTSSAKAMLTGVSAAAVGNSTAVVDSERATRGRSSRQTASSGGPPLLKAVRQAMVAEDAKAQTAAPKISPNGVVPLYGKVGTIQPGEWISIYVTNLASGTAIWQGKFVTSLAGTSVKINGRDAYPVYVNPAQFNVQAPDDTTTGPVTVTLTTTAGSTSAIVSLNPYSPSFSLLDTRHVSAIILRADKSGHYGSGTYDILGPTGTWLGYVTVAAKAGDHVESLASQILANDIFYGDGTSSTFPLRLHEARAALLSPLAGNVEAASMRTINAMYNGAQVFCVLLSGARGASAQGRRWDETEDCMDPQSGLLVLHSQVPGRHYAYDYPGGLELNGHRMPSKVTVTEGGRTVSEISVVSLTRLASAGPNLFVPTASMKPNGSRGAQPPEAVGRC